jgi:hypothetical protein
MVPAFPGGRDIIRRAFALKGMANETIKVSMASLTDASIRQYETALKNGGNFVS